MAIIRLTPPKLTTIGIAAILWILGIIFAWVITAVPETITVTLFLISTFILIIGALFRGI